MGQFVPVLVAFILTCCNSQIFRENSDTEDNGPLLSCYIFLFSMFILIWDQRLYPKSLRKHWKGIQLILEFLIADFLMEQLLLDFWLPLEKSVIKAPPKLAETIEGLLREPPFEREVNVELLKSEMVGPVASYALSLFFLICVAHATRAIDLRTLEFGIRYFAADNVARLAKFAKKQAPKFILDRFFKEGCSHSGRSRNKSRKSTNGAKKLNDYDFEDDSDLDFEHTPDYSSTCGRTSDCMCDRSSSQRYYR